MFPSDPFFNSAPWSWAFHTEIVGIICFIVILIYALLTKKDWGRLGYTAGIFHMVAVSLVFMIYSLYSSEFMWVQYGNVAPFYPTARFTSSLIVVFFKFLLLVLTLICLVLYKPFFVEENDKWEYALLLLLMVLAMLILMSTMDLFIGFIALEVQTLTLYIMVGLKRYSNLSMEAAQKFFFFAAFSSCCFGLGLSIFYALTSTTNIYHLSFIFNTLLPTSGDSHWVAILGGLFILVALLFKLTLVPFHFWVGDVFQGSYGYFSSFIAIVSKLPVVFLLIKLFYWILVFLSPYFAILLKVLSVLSIIFGAFYAFTELSFKRFWALTAIVNFGYIVFSLSLGTAEGLVIAFFYLFLYLLNTVFIWILFLHLVKKPAADFAFNEFLTKLISWTSLSEHRLSLATCITFILFSLAGLPPGAGFLPKAWLFLHLYLLHDFFLLFIIFAFSFLSMAYYIRVARFILFPSNKLGEQPLESFEQLSSFYVYILIVVFFLNLFFIVFFFDLTLYFLYLAQAFLSF